MLAESDWLVGWAATHVKMPKVTPKLVSKVTRSGVAGSSKQCLKKTCDLRYLANTAPVSETTRLVL